MLTPLIQPLQANISPLAEKENAEVKGAKDHNSRRCDRRHGLHVYMENIRALPIWDPGAFVIDILA